MWIQLSGVRQQGINRNIVECKYQNWGLTCWNGIELIETLWNVNKKSEAEKKRQVKN